MVGGVLGVTYGIFSEGVNKFMESWKLERLSELTAISRRRDLTASEQQERQKLRNEYRAAVTGSLRADLVQVTIVEPDGTRHDVVQSGNFDLSDETRGED